jgi:peptidoglycan/LPS O-acetylase OafA/YrhL
VAIGAAGLVLHAVMIRKGGVARLWTLRPLGWIGRISYSLYLCHYPVFHVLRVERFQGRGWSLLCIHALRLTAVFGAACVSFYLVERPFLKLKARIGRVERALQ